MEFAAFVKYAIAQDSRNRFGKYDGDLSCVPLELQPFYRDFNPEDVEIDGANGAVHFCPANKLAELQKEYSFLNVQFIFATCNGDPIFFHDGQIFTCPHGVSRPEWEKLSNDFVHYILVS